MPRIVVKPEALRAFSAQLQQAANDLRAVGGRVGGALGSLDWEARQKAGVDGQVNDARARTNALASQAEDLARYLRTKAQAFEEADRQGEVDLQLIIAKYPIPFPTPTPIPDQENTGPMSVEDIIRSLDDLLKPIDWISDSKKASKMFRETLRGIGRLLNLITGQRGHIKQMDELVDILTGTTKTISSISTLLDMKDFRQYFAGGMTNQEIARTAIKVLFPIPILNDRLADWMVKNMPNPDGKWRGLAPKVE